MTSKADSTSNQLQLKPLVCMERTPPFLSCLTKKLVNMSGDPRESQWLQQRLSLAVIRGNTARILACVQLCSDLICSLFGCFWCTYQNRCLPLAPESMHSHCLPNPHSFCKFHCSFSCAVLLCRLINYLINRTAKMRLQPGVMFLIPWNLWGIIKMSFLWKQEPPVCLKMLSVTVYCAQHDTRRLRGNFHVTIIYTI